MHIDILTLFPQMVESFFTSSIMARAVEKGIITYRIINFRDYAHDRHRTCDDIPYGGGAGMILKCEPLGEALDSIDAKNRRVIYPSPSGRLFNQAYAQELSRQDSLVFICGHYEGLDQRIIDEYVDDEISIGDYVISSGESAATVIIDAVYRLVEGVEYPQYTRPERYCTKSVPDVLLSGHHERIATWRDFRMLEKTMRSRPEVLSKASLDLAKRRRLIELINEMKG